MGLEGKSVIEDGAEVGELEDFGEASSSQDFFHIFLLLGLTCVWQNYVL